MDWSALTESLKEYALVKATDYVNYAFKWRGKKSKQEQSLAFPRLSLIDNDGYTVTGIPAQLMDSVCECALLIAKGVDMFEVKESNGQVTSERIGSLAFTYDTSKKENDKTLYDAINLRLRGLYIDTNKNKIFSGGVSRV